jgi:flagellar hook-associated protein FlgK
MPNVYDIALSGLQAAGTRLGVSAHNVANSTTPGFKPDEAVQKPQESGGVIVDVRSGEFEGVSLDQEVANQLVAGYDYKANLQVLKTQNELDQSLLDITA